MTEESVADDDVENEEQEIVDFEANAEELFERNMATFAKMIPQIHKRISEHTPISKLKYLDNGEPTVEFNDESVYEDGAVTEAKRQHENYIKFHQRLRINAFSSESLDIHARAAYDRFLARVEESGLAFSPTPKRETSYFTICMGIGLAQHIDELVERTDCWVLVLVEPNMDFLYHSLSVYDWRPLLERMSERQVIDFLIGSDMQQTSASLHSVFRGNNPAGLDGTTLYRHYQTGMTQEIERTFSSTIMTSVMGLGFFQDEINMVSQTYKNLEKGTTRLIQAVGESPQMPCAIVANGPSLDDTIKMLKKNEDKFIIFACGSAITTLMEQGIKPDFWIMTERIKAILEMVEDVDDRFGVRDVVFIGSTTVFPGVTDHFDDFILFFRPGLSSAPLFATRHDQILKVPDPLAANSGLSAALHLGFREFYFMGVDVGSRFSDRGHASGGFYANREDHIKTLDVPLPANFGGTVWSTPVLKWSKEGIEKLTLSSPGRVFYNLSDGALINGATPMHRKAVKVKTPVKPKQEAVQELTKKCEIFTLEDFDERWEDAAIIDRIPEFCDDLRTALVDDDMSSFKYAYGVSKILEPGMSKTSMAMLVRGSVFTFMIAVEYWHNRIADDGERKVLRQIYKEEFSNLLDVLGSRSVEMFSGVEDGEPWVEEFVE